MDTSPPTVIDKDKSDLFRKDGVVYSYKGIAHERGLNDTVIKFHLLLNHNTNEFWLEDNEGILDYRQLTKEEEHTYRYGKNTTVINCRRKPLASVKL